MVEMFVYARDLRAVHLYESRRDSGIYIGFDGEMVVFGRRRDPTDQEIGQL